MFAWFHPIVAVVVLALLAHVASLGARARSDRRHRAQYLARHAAIGPWVFGGVTSTWIIGLVSVSIIRPPAEVAASWHFWFGSMLVVVLALSALTSRLMHLRVVRSLHPWIGVAALLLAAAQVFFGLQILP